MVAEFPKSPILARLDSIRVYLAAFIGLMDTLPCYDQQAKAYCLLEKQNERPALYILRSGQLGWVEDVGFAFRSGQMPLMFDQLASKSYEEEELQLAFSRMVIDMRQAVKAHLYLLDHALTEMTEPLSVKELIY